ncbi:D-3-phosphoglycerate dehydrogenase, variant 2 [Capsaspora owczarzaki ATCC 30864]|nr:D-3-phosphoglycerate dehydrogenase, variant 1 [Capsaspora owczarzaki ATCC 30864]KJE94798.1 D-3-phosphoglycerate dehydrogenase, variant 2 [Capsaspora owczarzaki ATCC 30864]
MLEIKRVLVVDGIDDVCVKVLADAGFQVDKKDKITKDEVLATIKDYDALIVRSATKVTKEIIAAGTRLKIIGRAGTGVDNIDTDAATHAGIIVMNTPGGNTLSAAEHTCAMISALARQIPQAHATMKQGKWDRKNFMGVELHGKTIAILGLGRIGREVATRMQAYGMKTIGYDPILPKEAAKAINIDAYDLDELWPLADFITVHTPLTESTRHLLNDAVLAKCKKGVRIVNCARGGIIEEAALLRALESGHVAGAALDVFDEEPPKDIANNKLIQHPNCIVTPHLGASTEEAQAKVALEIGQQIVEATHGSQIMGAVNAPAMMHALRDDLKPWVILGSKLGLLAAQLMVGSAFEKGSSKWLHRLTVTAQGKAIQSSSSTLCAAVLMGILNHLQATPVNLVNASMIADALGLHVREERTSEPHDEYQNVLSLRYTTETEDHEYAGTVFGTNNLRFTRIDQFAFEVRPAGHLMFYRNEDKPGVIAAIGTHLAQASINIADLTLGRDDSKREALCIVNTDQPIPADVLQRIQQTSFITYARTVTL